jgi:energy-coupling factor transporter transmembrane protein EcfT
MRNKNGFLWEILSSVLFVAGIIFMMFSFLISGIILLSAGFLTSLFVLNKKRIFNFRENFLVISALLSLIIIIYISFISYSGNIIIISSSFYALNFLIQINYPQKKKVRLVKSVKGKNKDFVKVKRTKSQEKEIKEEMSTVKEAIKGLKKDLKDEIKKSAKKSESANNAYYYTDSGKSFHLPGCISISRTKQENLKKSDSRNDLISKGYKTCKACNS